MRLISDRIQFPGRKTRQAAWIALSNLLSFCISLLLSAILSRHLSPVEYGTFRQILYVYNTLLIIFSLGLPKAYSYFLARIPIEEGRDTIRRLTLICLTLASVFSLVLYLGSGIIADALRNPALRNALRLFAIVPLTLMPVLGVESTLVVYKMTGKVLLYVVITRTLTVLTTTIPVLGGFGIDGALTGFTASSVVTCAAGLVWLSVPFRNVRSRKSSITIREIMHFSMPVLYSGIYGFIIGSASQFFISRYFGVEDFAVFANGYRELPFASMVIGAVSAILLPEFSNMAKKGKSGAEFLAMWENTVLKSSMVIYPLSLFFFIFAPEIINFLYGDGYARSVPLFRIVTIINLCRIVPYGPLLFAVGKGNLFANAHMVTAILIVTMETACVKLFPSVETIAAIASLCTVFCLAIMLKGVADTLGTTFIKVMPWYRMLKILAISIATASVSRLAVMGIGLNNAFVALLAGFTVFSILYITVANLAGTDYLSILKLRTR